MLRAVTVLVLSMIPVTVAYGQGAVAPPNPASGLVGTWEMVEEQVLGAQDEIVARDRDVVGMIVYSPEGRMAVQIMYRRGRPVVSAKKDVVSTGLGLGEIRWSAEDARAAIDTYDAYFGTYEVDREQSIVTHHVLGELRPPGVGARYRRRYELRGDDLWLSSTDSKERWRIVWRRVR